MSVLIVPDSFKGTYTAAEVAGHIAAGVGRAGGTAVGIPVADGGEGTFDALCAGLGAVEVKVSVRNPWGSPVTATLGLAGDTAIVELAQASGLHVLHNGERDPLTADTYGTGQLILEAVARGARRVLVAAGGSATTDGGTGAVRAITQAGGLHGAQIIVLSDVTTKFPDAARIFGPQKGADPATVELLTARLLEQARTFPRDPSDVAGTGAAGGFSGGLWAHFGAELVSGAEFVLDAVDFDLHLARATAVVVGEGRLDGQSMGGKIISVVLQRVAALAPQVPVFAVVGSIGADLGTARSHFADVMVASTPADMVRAGLEIQAVLRQPAI
ncbi:glycerate kinase [Paeniglutamicibacter sp. Y32M11]|uniref:glycerate kinase n=1 Tax=Paeniglutamicibacter sp. Y32M11 TaxID=2853258 RepID=UPI001C528E0C|nr:glycerate kinase [Paeniglutamicibacter sp. Y32M11]QXQ10352.1 glycerate kinase [Paeniglutamicibacter sp. Y32M11]